MNTNESNQVDASDTRDLAEHFEERYAGAQGDASAIPWARLEPHPLLVGWLREQQVDGTGQRAAVTGCGLGDDAEDLARLGFAVSAFDISPTAIDWCRRRFPGSPVDYRVADLLHLPDDLRGAFDLVLDSRTLQAIPDELRPAAMRGVASLVAPGGRLLIICRGRDLEEPTEGPPVPLTHDELRLFESESLVEDEFLDTGGRDEPMRQFRVAYHRPTRG